MKKKMTKLPKIEDDLFDANHTDNDKEFIKNLSKWVIKYFGNVNVAQRLNIINIRGLKCD